MATELSSNKKYTAAKLAGDAVLKNLTAEQRAWVASKKNEVEFAFAFKDEFKFAGEFPGNKTFTEAILAKTPVVDRKAQIG